ncbi:hypothetical protein ACT80S_01255 [Ramlibacter sp. MAHUQ-53]|uniref:hypothetical protein n=1 Tax=unclassified Ramlibacter TaxID=2617605 RepID=UPI003628B117
MVETKTIRGTRALAALALAGLLAACGGGGGGAAAPATKAASSVQDMQGRWENAAANWDAKWLAPAAGQSASPIWLLARDGSYLAYLEGTVAADGKVRASGTRYTLDSATQTTSAASWDGTATIVDGATRLAFADGTSMTRSAAQPLAVQGEVTGAWTSQLGADLVTLSYAIDAQGVLTGSSTTGCTYAGYVVVRPNSFVYDAKVSETCIDGVAKLLEGIGSLASDKARLTLTLRGPAGAYAKALYFIKKT